MQYVKHFSGSRFAGFRIMPGTGAGASGPLISYMIGRGDRFIIVLDDDNAGRKARDTYADGYYLNSDMVVTVAQIDQKFKNMRLEGMIDDTTKLMIQSHFVSEKKSSKKQIGLYLSEVCATSAKGALSKDSFDNFLVVLEYAKEHLSSQQ